MRKAFLSAAFAASVALIGYTALTTGCATSQQVTPTTNTLGVVTLTTNTVVNQAILTLDCAAVQSVAAATTTIILQKDPSAASAFTDFQLVLSGVINGASSNSASQLVSTFSKSSDPTLVTEITPLVSGVSTLEQSLIAKYGVTAAGQIAIAVTKAISAGITAAMNAPAVTVK